MKREKILQERIFEKLEGLFDKVIYERKHGYEANPKPDIKDIEHIIRHYSSKCAKISLGATLIPGQWGVISAVPEIVLGMKKQAEMIYDISAAYKKDKIMSHEMLAGILLFAASGESFGLLRYENGKYILNQSHKLFDSALNKIAKKIARQILRSVLVRWLPGFGTVSQALISGRVTRRIGNVASDILTGDIQIVEFKDIDSYDKYSLDIDWLASNNIVIADEDSSKK
ncbi:MAG TPA: hypothetical protein VGK25_08695 [Ignavibacteria bacterium]